MINGITNSVIGYAPVKPPSGGSSCQSSSNSSQIVDDIFTKLDANNDGSVDKTELSSFLQTISANRTQTANADDIFAKLDANGDGKISKDEIQAGLQATHQKHHHHHKHAISGVESSSNSAVQQYEIASQASSTQVGGTVSVTA